MKKAMAVLALISVVSIGCGDLSLQPDKDSFRLDNDQGTGSEKSFKIAVPIPKLAVDNVSKVEYLLTGADMEDLRGELVIGDDDVARGVVRGVKAGNNRTVTLNALNSSGVITYTGSSVINVTAGEKTSVNVVMKATNVTDGDVEISGTFEDGTSSGTTTIVVANQIDDGEYTYMIYELYISPSSADTWGSDLLGDSVLNFGLQFVHFSLSKE